MATVDAVHHRPSGLSPDRGRFKLNRMNGLDVDGDDAKHVSNSNNKAALFGRGVDVKGFAISAAPAPVNDVASPHG